MKIIVGLGNPGKKYENTRHNVGFLALDKISEKMKAQSEKPIEFRLEKKFNAEVVKFKMGKEEILLVKPQTFMNLSGEAVKKTVDFYKVNQASDLIVVHDDIDLPVGSTRIRFKGSSAGHKGLQSIIDSLATESFMRVRLGVGRPENENIKVEDWVLQKLSREELKVIEGAIEGLVKQGMGYLA